MIKVKNTALLQNNVHICNLLIWKRNYPHRVFRGIFKKWCWCALLCSDSTIQGTESLAQAHQAQHQEKISESKESKNLPPTLLWVCQLDLQKSEIQSRTGGNQIFCPQHPSDQLGPHVAISQKSSIPFFCLFPLVSSCKYSPFFCKKTLTWMCKQ